MATARSKADKATTFTALNARYLQERPAWTQNFTLRMHRALSWLKAAHGSEDLDTRFVLLWIAFNACYARENDAAVSQREQRIFFDFFSRVCRLDAQQRLYAIIWTDYASSIRLLLDNQYVFNVFWLGASGKLQEKQWQAAFARSKEVVKRALGQQDTVTILNELFSRLYTLRNQLVHGGATWRGRVNRAQLRNGTQILERIVPAVLVTMMEHPHAQWGKPPYPVQ